MIQFYRPPSKNNKIPSNQILQITDESQLKDAIHKNTVANAKILNLKNSNIKKDSLYLLINIPLKIIELNLAENFSFISDQSIEILSKLNLNTLTILNLADNQITDDSLICIAKSPVFAKLQQLIVYGNSDITSEGIIILADSKNTKNISKLDLHATSIDDAGISYFIRSQNASSLTHLNLSMNWKRVTDKTLYSIGISKYCSKLVSLELEDCAVTDIGVDEICQSQNCANLAILSLNNSMKQKNNKLSDKCLSSIAFSKNMINLKTLELRNTQVTPKGIKTFAVSLSSEKLELIRLSYCDNITAEVLNYVQKIVEYQSLKKVYLNNTRITKEDCQQFEAKNPQVHVIY